MAASVPFAEDDVVNGLAEPSSLPYSTLLTLPPRGHRLVATFIAVDTQFPGSTLYPGRALPLRIGEATPYIENGTQIRPDQPLGQYQLRAAVSGWNVEVNAYFGTPRPSARLLDAAQRQLDELLTRPAPTPKRALPTADGTRQDGFAVARPHVRARPGFLGSGTSRRVHRGTGRGGAGWRRPAFARSASARGAAASAVENNVAWISAGRPSAEASVASRLHEVHLPVPHLGDGRGQPRPLPQVVGEALIAPRGSYGR